jgi:alkylation response protein AidB-like acyl-CoA dehydrogenase
VQPIFFLIRVRGGIPMATSVVTKLQPREVVFCWNLRRRATFFTPADLTDDQKLIGQTAEEFVLKEVLPLAKDLENKKPDLMAELVRKGGELGCWAEEFQKSMAERGSTKSRRPF